MKKNAINWFEIYASDLSRATGFYEEILQTKLISLSGEGCPMRMFPADEEAGGVTGALTLMDGCSPGVGGTLVYLNVEGDLDAVLARVSQAGGKVIRDRFAIPPYGFIGIIEDTEGNAVGLHSMT